MYLDNIYINCIKKHVLCNQYGCMEYVLCMLACTVSCIVIICIDKSRKRQITKATLLTSTYHNLPV